MRFNIDVEVIRWDDTIETYEQLRFLVAPQGILRNPQDRSQLLLGAIDTQEINVGDWVIQFPGRLNLVFTDKEVPSFVRKPRFVKKQPFST